MPIFTCNWAIRRIVIINDYNNLLLMKVEYYVINLDSLRLQLIFSVIIMRLLFYDILWICLYMWTWKFIGSRLSALSRSLGLEIRLCNKGIWTLYLCVPGFSFQVFCDNLSKYRPHLLHYTFMINIHKQVHWYNLVSIQFLWRVISKNN